MTELMMMTTSRGKNEAENTEIRASTCTGINCKVKTPDLHYFFLKIYCSQIKNELRSFISEDEKKKKRVAWQHSLETRRETIRSIFFADILSFLQSLRFSLSGKKKKKTEPHHQKEEKNHNVRQVTNGSELRQRPPPPPPPFGGDFFTSSR